MARVVFFGTPCMGHVNPTLGLVSELVARGENVRYYATSAFRDSVERTGAEWVAYPESCFSAARTGAGLLREIVQQMPVFLDHEMTRLRHEPPDYVIHHCMAAWGSAAAKLLGIPAVCNYPLFAFNSQVRRLVRKAAKTSFSMAHWRDMAAALLEWIKVARYLEHKYERRLRLKQLFHGDLNLVNSPASLQPCAETFNESYRFVGALTLESKPDPIEFPWERITSNKLVYISLGTAFNRDVEFVRLCAAALSDFRGQVVYGGGGYTLGQAVGQLPDNFIMCNLAPQRELLKKASAFITHAGFNSMVEGVYEGVPLVMLPQIPEQFLNAAKISQLGAGLMLPPRNKLAAHHIRNAVDRVIADSSFRDNSQKVGELFWNPGGCKKAVDEIFRWKEGLPGSAFRSAAFRRMSASSVS